MTVKDPFDRALAMSVVIPTYNRRDLVVRAIRALAHQRPPAGFEVIVVVDGSTDGTADALHSLASQMPVRILEQPNRGAAVARNQGARAARGDILLFLDDDMEAAPDLVAEHVRCHGEEPTIVIGHLPLHPESPVGILRAGIHAWAEERLARLAAADAAPGYEDLLTGQMSIPRETFQTLGGFDSAFTKDGAFGNEDLDFGRRAREHGVRLVFNSRAISWQHYVVTPAAYLRQRRDLGAADVVFARKYPSQPSRIGTGGVSTWRARYLWKPVLAAPLLGSLVRWTVSRAAIGLLRLGATGYFARRLFSEACSLQYWTGVRGAGGEPPYVPPRVLAYHAVRELPSGSPLAPYTVAPWKLERQLDTLLAAGFRFIEGDAFLAHLWGDRELPPRSVLLTFDDCYTDLRDTVIPILRQRGIPAVAFAVSGQIGGVNAWDRHLGAEALPLLDGESLRALRAHQVEVGAHSHTHRPLNRVPHGELAQEVSGCVEALACLGVPRPRFFSYPHGEWNREVIRACREAGVAAAFGIRAGFIHGRCNRLALPRIEIGNDEVGNRFARAVALADCRLGRTRVDSRLEKVLTEAWHEAARIRQSGLSG
jgi:glycosyltransferase involved in cell wall biosynthesis/peptidoglycan/xylan/chitin deacetylase (PgdA/CDA1 family)